MNTTIQPSYSDATSKRNQPKGWLLYDGSCGLCSEAVLHSARMLRKYGFEVAPLQSSWVKRALGETYTLEDIRLLLPNGTQKRGPDVCRHLLRQIWWLRLVYWMSILPGVHIIFDGTYYALARQRHRFSRTCRVSPRIHSAQPDLARELNRG